MSSKVISYVEYAQDSLSLKWSAWWIGLSLLASLILLFFFGVTSSYVGLRGGEVSLVVIGVLFVLCGVALTSKIVVSILFQEGDKLSYFIARQEGLTLRQLVFGKEINLSWSSIEKVVFSSKFLKRSAVSRQRFSRVILIFLKDEHSNISFLERGKLKLTLSAEGKSVFLVRFPKTDTSHLLRKLDELTRGDVKVSEYSDVCFDYASQSDEYKS